MCQKKKIGNTLILFNKNFLKDLFMIAFFVSIVKQLKQYIEF